MGEIANAMINGECCALCGQFFKKPHGYPVACKECWEKDCGYQKAIYSVWQKQKIYLDETMVFKAHRIQGIL